MAYALAAREVLVPSASRLSKAQEMHRSRDQVNQRHI